MTGISDQPLAAASTLDWGMLYDRYAGEIARYLLKLTRDDQEAKDLIQETFVRAIGRQSQLRDRARVRPWLYRIATNLAMSRMRKAALRSWLPLPPAHHSDPATRIAEAEQIRHALRSLSPAQAVSLVLRERGFSREEIAEISGVTPEAVKSRLARGEANFIAAYRRLERGLAK